MKKMIVFIACAAMLCACGGSNSQSAGDSKSQPTEEFKKLPASSLVLKGKHAKLFKLAEDTYAVNLVKTDDSWQVRVKMKMTTQTPFNQIKDSKNYEREIKGPYGQLLNSSEVELESLDMSDGDLDMLLQEDEEETEIALTGRTWSYKHMDYTTAKELFDKTVSVEISGLELEPAEKKSSKMIDDDTQETLDDMKDILEAEGEMINALKGLL